MSVADLSAQHEALAEILAVSKKMGLAVTAATNIRRQLDTLVQDLKKKDQVAAAVGDAVQAFSGRFQAVEEKVVPKDFGSTQMTRELALQGGSLNQQILMLGMSISGFPAAPTRAEVFQLAEVMREVENLVSQLNQVISEDIASLNRVLEQNALPPLKAPEKVKL
jgi:hypothetical protein